MLIMLPVILNAQEHLPKVINEKPAGDFVASHYRLLAAKAFQTLTIADNKKDWLKQRELLRKKIIEQSGALPSQTLSFAIKETGEVQQSGYSIKNIRFQTRPNVFATGNLYLPAGKGPFPAVIVTHGHWPNARRSGLFQEVAQVLVKSGYVVLTIDAWGAGERCTDIGKEEYHGANLGASLLNVGQSLLGMQLTDNMRGVDLLCSLPEVDAANIGATGASGGGNQAMWLAAVDERIKAVVPVVSVGTFQSYIMNSNCVCELLPNGLTYAEEAAVLGLVAPRALKILSATNDSNPSFFPSEMLKSYERAKPIFSMMRADNKLAYELFDTGHGYWPTMRESMLGWFDLQLKSAGEGQVAKTPEVSPLAVSLLATYPSENRESGVATTASFCQSEGLRLHDDLLRHNDTSLATKGRELKILIGQIEEREIKEVKDLGLEKGWQKKVLITDKGQYIPFLWHASSTTGKLCRVFFHPSGKDSISRKLIELAIKENENILLVDLWGTGEQSSAESRRIDGQLPDFHTLSRSSIWLGRTVMGEWFADINAIYQWLMQKGHKRIELNAYKESAVAALIFSGWNKVDVLNLYDAPYSYRFDQRAGIDFFNMSIHLPNVLKWGDISLMSALSLSKVYFYHPRSMSGKLMSREQAKVMHNEVECFVKQWDKSSKVEFLINDKRNEI